MSKMQAPSPNNYDDNEIVNPSTNTHFQTILEARLTRRQTVFGGISAATAALFGTTSLSACGGSGDAPLALGFAAVAKNKLDVVTVADGYRVSVLHSLGDPLQFGDESWKNDGSETSESYQRRVGDGHDGMWYFGLGEDGKFLANRSDRGLLCVNHEYVVQPFGLHPNGQTAGTSRVASEVEKEKYPKL